MKHVLFAPEQNTYDIAILIKDSSFIGSSLSEYYVEPLEKLGIPRNKIIAFNLPYDKKKVSSNQIHAYFNQLIPALDKLGIKYIYCADAEYFKTLTKQRKADNHLGYVLDCAAPKYKHMKVVLGLNYGGLLYNPNQAPKLDLSLTTLADSYNGCYQQLGANIIHKAQYPVFIPEIQAFLNSLHQYPSLTCDIEAFSLNPFEAGIGSIAFAWNKHEGGSFLVDWIKNPDDSPLEGQQRNNKAIKSLLKHFFINYKGNIKYHNMVYDAKVLILELFMSHPQDYEGMLYGLEVMTRDIDDTKVIAYLALNTTAELSLGLKDLGHEYAGDYAESDIKNIRLITQESLLKYNLTDCLTTWFVFDKYYPVMLQDSQQHIYETIMKPSIKILIQMELVGMPIDTERVLEVEQELEQLKAKYLKQLADSTSVQQCQKTLQLKELTAINSKLKTKQHGLDKVADYVFNPNSGNHLTELLYNVMSLPVIDTTATKLPSTSGDTLEKLLNHTSNQDYTTALNALIGLSKVDKILTSFIPSFKQAVLKGDGLGWLHANFNLNGTVSGRLSCSKPNLQQIPSGSDFGKLIKSCFKAPKGWVFAGADFASLEDRINTLLTKDTNKLKVYTDGYDGHCLRAAYYFKIPVDVNNVAEVNAIKKTHPEERQDSKAPTFALTYMGTWATLMKNCGFTEQLSKEIETNYHELYKESDAWAKDKLDLCCKQGYIDVAFGLRIRTPLLAKSVLDNSKTLREAQAEARSVGNAISGQSYGLLNNRAAIAFMNRVWASEFKYDVFLVSLIHDAIYLIMKDDIRVVEWVNNALTEEMSWQELPEIQHPQVKLSAELDVFYGGWHQPITLPNHASKEDILHICKEGVAEYNKP